MRQITLDKYLFRESFLRLIEDRAIFNSVPREFLFKIKE